MKNRIVAMASAGFAMCVLMAGSVHAASGVDGALNDSKSLISTNNLPALTFPLTYNSFGLDLGLSSAQPVVRGLQLELLMASIPKMTGLQFNGGIAGAKDLFGLQTGLLASLAGEAAGIQLGGLFGSSVFGEMNGIQISPGWVAFAEEVCGAQLGGDWVAIAKNGMTGIQFGGIASLAGGNVKGIQIGGNFAVVGGLEENDKVVGNMSGIQIAGLCASSDSMQGIQLAPLNMADSVGGIQIAVVNIADDMSGIQMGVVNQAKKLSGIQIGLLNHHEQGGSPWLPVVNAGF